MNFYGCIIGSEILNGRREDKHFEFLKNELQKYGHELFASFIIKDDENLIKKIYKLIKDDESGVMFSFGGIGATPDDLTRAIAAEVFTSKPLERHKIFEQDIIDRFGSDAYPHRIHMSDLPQNSKLLLNPINNMSGFSLEDRYFFTPGFPQMSHPMISAVIEKLFSNSVQKYRLTLLAQTSENTLINIMEQVSPDIELSSLPMLKDAKASVEISLQSTDKLNVEKYFKLFTDYLDASNITYNLI
ncbi:MAG: molybdopterin-binding protein [Sulfurimonas sp. RIFCSPHIGHO2_12_FULL_36_9]|uniref:competence/damage-inducible protein A n=1 Tax=Sulfurimonas sp. RIFCSPLOWO2_12_36_12 TaxID=1802253 RepID=UPI0008D34C8A|nr:molybdopterin-binding protein [Sulfurimonas sp. RIFCSPLOWO2_12_36_12]OHD96806.1 MAG: molybdopterin-binding protein [Sulfurimonas sp. RIFCSPHIGHO2_12_FULL_36_9]OHD97597.1 MAG: molybdopterin-binding protein [Sulfurimonas sp. RIFCSPLOWO2_02_FULL_36_28]OHE01863.1 MAG: molybdopterin-binding protein [Sulfurimonas sp. RIFCSPLOWO2_12_36_12]OHE07413.1 MAG: molybdopterin-binding protein [Sulfurimonas sp. RIFCSPLOWO2_12_FULL_36_74]